MPNEIFFGLRIIRAAAAPRGTGTAGRTRAQSSSGRRPCVGVRQALSSPGSANAPWARARSVPSGASSPLCHTNAALRMNDKSGAKRLHIRNAMFERPPKPKAYFKNAGHCTRCEEPFGGNATAYMVREYVVWSTIWGGQLNLCQYETIPVCDACLKPNEQERTTIDATCKGCGQRMRLSELWPARVCSNRCAQRDRRKRRRMAARTRCGVCRTIFTPRRRDAKFCSVACKQRAYRRAHGIEQVASDC